MEFALKISAFIALIAFTILAIFAMVSLSGIVKSIRELSINFSRALTDFSKLRERLMVSLDELSELKSKVATTLDDFADVKIKAIETLDNANKTTEQISLATSDIQGKANSMLNMFRPFESLARSAYSKVAPPVMMTTGVISAISKAVSVFSNVLSKKK